MEMDRDTLQRLAGISTAKKITNKVFQAYKGFPPEMQIMTKEDRRNLEDYLGLLSGITTAFLAHIDEEVPKDLIHGETLPVMKAKYDAAVEAFLYDEELQAMVKKSALVIDAENLMKKAQNEDKGKG